MSQQEFMIGIVGFGGMGNWHRELIDSIEGLTVAGIYDIKEERSAYARDLKIKAYANLPALLSDPKIGLVLIATPNDVHKSLAMQAMAAGKHVVCEKPVALNSMDLNDMIEASRKYGRLFTVHQNRRWDEDFLTVKKVYEEGRLGEIFRIESRVQGSRGIPGDWRQEKERGGGMVLDWGVHLLDQILYMFGESKLNYVYATLTNVTNQLVDDGFTAWLTFENGIEVLVEVGTNNFVSLPRWYVLGVDGTAVIKDFNESGKIVSAVGKDDKDVVPVRTAAGLTKTMAPRREDTIKAEELPLVKSDVKDFYRNIMAAMEGREEVRVKLAEISRVMRLMEAVFQSSREHKVIEFET
ncbi:oxidoreductase [Anaerocolumna cellulosilytica]|uniref:Oxidoreductase n=1 Tax=Anaerocolumna cellulosilytica TaxID=433286 RepID=A0A6S6R923_9FIRM|nr:Gfo/Idh/MocA family oxidoreductase [Anaerocolumna cellulosilytica]MBB5195378.1 putative dehydrogenase [Anaerocolumna cellulosilytica]BCJ95910.1 oxidoreductase [Anaerocolumna cellulosilytica]